MLGEFGENLEAYGSEEVDVKVETDAKIGEVVYSAAELAAASKGRFGVPSEVVLAAMRIKGLKKASFAEAQEVVKAFMESEVD